MAARVAGSASLQARLRVVFSTHHTQRPLGSQPSLPPSHQTHGSKNSNLQQLQASQMPNPSLRRRQRQQLLPLTLYLHKVCHALSLRSKTVDVTEAPATGVPGGSLSRSVFAGRPNNGAAEPFLASFIDDFEPMAVEKATEERWRSESRRVRVCFTSLSD